MYRVCTRSVFSGALLLTNKIKLFLMLFLIYISIYSNAMARIEPWLFEASRIEDSPFQHKDEMN